MARYAEFSARRVSVVYRAADIFLPATGKLVADSGKSIFLEESNVQHGKVRTFRWEIPYRYIVSLKEVPTVPPALEVPLLAKCEVEESL
jgi:hypothetical protein